MTKKFKIEPINTFSKKYVIKKKVIFLFPFYGFFEMTKNEFFGDLNPYGEEMASREVAAFNSVDHAMDALHQYAQINGIEEIVVKIIS